MSETDLMRQILCAVSAVPGALFWRQNTGVFRSLSGREIVRCGVPGMADIGGCYLGKHVEIEVKTDKGRLSPAQKRWKMAVERAGGIWVLARNPADALDVLAALLDAQSCGLPVPIHKPAAVNSEAGNGEAVP
jgi:hypothetical protein